MIPSIGAIGMSKVETATGHTIWWVMDEDGEIVDWQFEHPGDCPMVIDESHDADGKLAWRGGYNDCAITYIEDFLKEDYFDDFMVGKGPGEHSVPFKYAYHYHPPCYPDYEPDFDFDWEPE